MKGINIPPADGFLKGKEDYYYNLVVNNMNDVIWVIDLSTKRFEYISPSIEKLSGYTTEEVMEQDIKDGLTEESYSNIMGELAQRIKKYEEGVEQDPTIISEFEQVHRDGHIFMSEVVTTLVKNPEGKVDKIIGVTREITGRKKVEQELKESEEKYKLISENTSDIIWIFDFNLNAYTYTSPALSKMLGYTIKEGYKLSISPDIIGNINNLCYSSVK